MKLLSTLLILLSCFLWTFSLFAQDGSTVVSDYILEYDAIKGQFTNKPTKSSIPKDHSMQIKILNINTLLYNVSITATQNDIISQTNLNEASLNYTVNELTYKVSDLYLNFDKAPIFNKTDSKSDRTNSLDTELKNLNKQIDNTLKELLNKYQNIEELDSLKLNYDSISLKNRTSLLKKYSLQDTLGLNQKITSINKEILSLEEKYDSQQHKYEQLNDNYWASYFYGDDVNRLVFKFNRHLTSYEESLKGVNQIISYYKNLICLVYSSSLNFTEIKERKNKLMENYLNVSTSTEIYGILTERLDLIDDRYDSLVYTFGELKTVIEDDKQKNEVDKIFNSVQLHYKNIKRTAFDDFFVHLVKVTNAISERNFTLTYSSDFTVDNADEIVYTFKATPISNAPCTISPRDINFSYKVPVVGGLKIDVSTGILGSVGVNQENYRFEETNAGVTVRGESSPSVFTPSVGFMINFYKRSSKNRRLAFSLGLATSDIKTISYNIGPSVIIGRSQRILAHLGLTLTQVNEPLDEYSEGTLLQQPITDLPSEVPLKEPAPYRAGLFFGITFNLTGLKNKEAVGKLTKL